MIIFKGVFGKIEGGCNDVSSFDVSVAIIAAILKTGYCDIWIFNGTETLSPYQLVLRQEHRTIDNHQQNVSCAERGFFEGDYSTSIMEQYTTNQVKPKVFHDIFIHLQAAFRGYDKNGDGRVTKAEFKRVMLRTRSRWKITSHPKLLRLPKFGFFPLSACFLTSSVSGIWQLFKTLWINVHHFSFSLKKVNYSQKKEKENYFFSALGCQTRSWTKW